MFLENTIHKGEKGGWIEVICGSMFFRKDGRIDTKAECVARIAKQKVEIFKPRIDRRYSEAMLFHMMKILFPPTSVETSAAILLLTGDVEVVGIDEGQFFDMGLIEVCNHLASRGVRVIVAALIWITLADLSDRFGQ